MNKKLFVLLLAFAVITPSLSRAELADIDPLGNSACLALQNDLRYRMTDALSGGEVSALQDFLQSEGYLNAGPSGFFGLMTTGAVKKFQSDHGISPTGYVGPLTRAEIKAVACGRPSSPLGGTISLPTPDSRGCLPGAVYSSTSGARCDTTNDPLQLKLSATQASDGAVHINASYDPNKYNPISVVLAMSCPAGVSAIDQSLLDGSDACKRRVIMNSIGGPGANRTVLKFTNTTGSAQRISFQATMAGAHDLPFGNNPSVHLSIPASASNNSFNSSSEQVKCVFNNSNVEQKCFATGTEYSFKGTGTAGGQVTGHAGTMLYWNSSCGDYGYTTIDGYDEYINFNCGSEKYY